jgi:hypothetical protein
VTVLYTKRLDISPRSFKAGIPGVHDRFEWFAVRYDGAFVTGVDGDYGFRVLSDDGSKVYVDGAEVIDNDGRHGPRSVAGNIRLVPGEHRLRVDYFQGPRGGIALQLWMTPPDGVERLYDASDSAGTNDASRTAGTKVPRVWE